MSLWMPASDAPELLADYECVLCYSKYTGNIWMDMYLDGFFSAAVEVNTPVTHFMPIPGAPGTPTEPVATRQQLENLCLSFEDNEDVALAVPGQSEQETN